MIRGELAGGIAAAPAGTSVLAASTAALAGTGASRAAPTGLGVLAGSTAALIGEGGPATRSPRRRGRAAAEERSGRALSRSSN